MAFPRVRILALLALIAVAILCATFGGPTNDVDIALVRDGMAMRAASALSTQATRPDRLSSALRNSTSAPSTGRPSPSISAPSVDRLRSLTGSEAPDSSRVALISTLDRRERRFWEGLLSSISLT